MAGVQNLKALFEKPNESTSPDRGRSGANSAASLETPSRPLSKVRTSFVSVERIRHRSLSIESSRILRSSSTNESEQPNGLPVNNHIKKIARGESALSQTTLTEVEDSVCSVKDEGKENDIKKTKEISVISKPESAIKSIKAFQGDKLSNTGKSPLSLKSPTLSASIKKPLHRSPVTPTPRLYNVKDSETKSIRKSTLPKTDDNAFSRSQAKNLPAQEKNKSRETPQPARARKIAPKSPTRPVKLPASLTTHTASSSLKTAKAITSNPGQPSLRRVSSNFQRSISSQRRMSTASNVSLMPKAQNVHHLTESSKRPPRQSIAPQNLTAELSFLARMTRPTASFSSKTTEKIVINSKKPSGSRPPTKNAMRNGASRNDSKKIPSTKKEEGKYVMIKT